MSLINNMLKDLEKRESSAPLLPPMALHSRKANTLLNSKLAYLVSLAFAICAIMYACIHLLSHQTNEPVALPLDDDKQVATQNDLTKTESALPATINAATIEINGDATELTFSLDHPVLYSLNSTSNQNEIELTIDQAQLQSELPPVNYLNTAIEGITQTQKDGNTIITLNLAKGSQLKSVNLSSDKQDPMLVISIKNPLVATEQNPTGTVDKTVKKQVMKNLLVQQYQSALNLAESGEYKSAIDHLTSLVKIDPDYKDARTSLAALLIDQGSLSKAKHIINEGINTTPDYIPFIELKARVLAAEGKPKEALNILHTATPSLVENPDYHAFIAAMHEQNNNHHLAVMLYTKLLQLNPHNGSWWFGLAVSLDKMGKDNQAIEAYNKASSEGHLNGESLAYLESRLDKLQEAVDDKQ